MYENDSEDEFVAYKKKFDTNLPKSVKQNKLVSLKSDKGDKRISTSESSSIPNSTTKDVLHKSSKLNKIKHRSRKISTDNNKKLFRKKNSNLNETGWIKTKNLSESSSSQLMIEKEIITLDIEGKVDILQPTGSSCKKGTSDMEVSNIEAANNKSQKPSTSFSRSFNEESENSLTNKLIVDNKVQKSPHFSKCFKKSDKSIFKISKSKLNVFNSLKKVKSKKLQKADCIINIDDSDSITSDEDHKNVKNDQVTEIITVNPNVIVKKIDMSTKELTNNKLAKENKPQNIISDSDLSSDDYIDISDSEVERQIEHKKKVQNLIASYQIKQQQQSEKTTNPLNYSSYKRKMICKADQNYNLSKKQKIVKLNPNMSMLDVFKNKNVHVD